ncbi:MAG: phosphate ABC transporter permease PstA [Spirochaetales bacterium]|nr:phosphate ABC transporter permease PstA [Spirochaetales bacterium]MCF7937320.1 phosphate ABC transporter permease PstA [Spirochaetales bacterium]
MSTLDYLSGTAEKDNIGKEHKKEFGFKIVAVLATLIGIVSLAVLLAYVFTEAAGWLDLQFLTSTPSRFAEKAGYYPAILGSAFVVALVALFALPLGVGAAVYLEEYSRKNFIQRFLQTNIANLAGVPSIVYGLLGLGLFVGTLGLPHGVVLVGAFTLTLRVLPIVIVSSQEAIRAVPDLQRQAALGLGATKWQMIRSIVLPEAFPGIMTGTIISLANAIGETAPLIMIGAATTIFSPPHGLLSSFSAMPLQIYAWSDFPKSEFQHGVLPAAIVVLLLVILTMNGIAVYARNKYYKNKK